MTDNLEHPDERPVVPSKTTNPSWQSEAEVAEAGSQMLEYIQRLEAQVKDLQCQLSTTTAALAGMREALEHIAEYWNQSENDRAMNDALYHMIDVAEKALSAPTPAPKVDDRLKAAEELAALIMDIEKCSGIDNQGACEWCRQKLPKHDKLCALATAYEIAKAYRSASPQAQKMEGSNAKT